MIVSYKHRYLFVQLPHTASTAIAKELSEIYDGVSILRKHALYHEFLKIAGAEGRKYFTFSCIRNPLDEAVSLYFKLKTNQAEHYTNRKSLRINGGFVTNTFLKQFNYINTDNADFPSYFKKFYSLKRIHRFPYDNLSCLSHERLDFIIRFENLQADFSRVLELIGLEQKRALPWENETGERESDFLAYYTPEIYGQAKKVFGPFMKKWGYDFPPQWGNSSISSWSEVHFRILGVFRKLYWKHLQYDSVFLRFFEQILP